MNEKLSALVDQELDQEQSHSQFSQVIKDDQLLSSWQNYHLIGQVIRDEVGDTRSDLSAKIARQLEAEPTVLAPKTARSLASKEKTRADSHRSERAGVLQASGLFALAASIVLVAVVSLERPDSADNLGESAQQVASLNTSAASQATPNTPISNEKLAQMSGEFGEMLAGHGEFTSSAGLNGLVAYAKLVSNQSMDQ